MDKRCSTCKKVLPIAQFSKNRSTKDGFQNECKSCVTEYKKRYYAEHRALLSQAAKDRYKENRAVKLEQSRRYYDEHKQERNSYRSAWGKRNPDKQKQYSKTHYEHNKKSYANYRANYNAKHSNKREAHKAVANALRNGDLRKPERCGMCRQVKPVDAHHFDYSKPLEVTWLCRSCHKLEHSRSNHFMEEAREVVD